MFLSDFDYQLPEDQIAQRPASRRESSRLLLLPRCQGPLVHGRFEQLPDLLRPGDLMVLNNTRVIPARIYGTKETGGRVEILLDRPSGPSAAEAGFTVRVWDCLLRASKPLLPGKKVLLPGGAEAVGMARPEGSRGGRVTLRVPGDLFDYLRQHGHIPLPNYIRRDPQSEPADREEDNERYQTVYAAVPGAVAAPTAGLHFSTDLLQRIRALGVEIAEVTLHVGPGTFLPVKTENVDDHVMHPERYEIGKAAAEAVTRARHAGRRVIAVGTTVVRTLESAWADDRLQAGEGETRLFIRPGFCFGVVDALVTNFHLPRSTLLMLVSAFSDRDRVLAAYRAAVAAGYRFFSYGDAMFIY